MTPLDRELALASHWVAMKQLVLLVIFAAIGTTLSGCVSTGPTQSAVSAEEAEKITEEITQLSIPWGKTVLTKDMAHLKRIFADDFAYIGTDGTVSDKVAELANFEDDTNTYTSSGIAAFNVRVYGKNFAVTDGEHHVAGKDKEGKPFSRKFRFTNVWVRKQMSTGERKWQVVAGHASQLE